MLSNKTFSCPKEEILVLIFKPIIIFAQKQEFPENFSSVKLQTAGFDSMQIQIKFLLEKKKNPDKSEFLLLVR